MKKIIFNITINIILFSLTILIFLFANQSSNVLIETLKYIFKVILPSLLPFMIFVNFILLTNCIDYLALIFKPLSKIFKISGYGVCIIIASILGGYPYNAILINNFLKENKINENEANRLLQVTFFPSISFILCLIRLDYNFIFIAISLYLSSIIILFITSKFKKYKLDNYQKKYKFIINNDFINIYFKVMKSSINSIFSIMFCIIFFRLISFPIIYYINNEFFVNFINGMFEFSSTAITILNKTYKTFKDYLLLNNIMAFSSFSIIFQSLYYLKDLKIFNFKKLIINKLIFCLISSIIFIMIFCIKN